MASHFARVFLLFYFFLRDTTINTTTLVRLSGRKIKQQHGGKWHSDRKRASGTKAVNESQQQQTK